MKRTITVFVSLLAAGLLSMNAQCCKNSNAACTSSTTELAQQVPSTKVQAYYFHATRRCATCEAVESVTKEALQEYYGEKVTFISINREEAKDHPLILKHKVSRQTLLFISGDKVINLTNDAFMNARTNPEKLKAKIKTTVDSML